MEKKNQQEVKTAGFEYVLEQLKRLDFKLQYVDRNRCIIKIGNKQIKVSSSRLKNEKAMYPQDVLYYGFTVLPHKSKKENNFDFFFGVGMDEDLKNPLFYIFTQREALSVEDVKIPRFPNVKKKIHIFETPTAYQKAIKSKDSQFVTPFEKMINENLSDYLNRWDKISLKT